MIVTGGGIRLDDIIGGTLNVGNVPIGRVAQSIVSSSNGGLVTLTASDTIILTLGLGFAFSDVQILLQVGMLGTKGATSGRSKVRIFQSTGTAVADFRTTTQEFGVSSFVSANDVWNVCYTGILEITTSGTITIGVNGLSAGSDMTIAAGECALHGMVLRNPSS